MKKKLLIIILAIAFLAELLFLLTRYIDLNKVNIAKQISQIIAADVEIKGDVKISFVPLPKLILEHVRIKNLPIGNKYLTIRAKKIHSSISLLSLITGSFKGKSVIIDQGVLSFDLGKKLLKKTNISSFSIANNSAVKEIEIKNSIFAISNQGKSLNYKNVNLLVNIDKNINIVGSFASKMDQLNLNADIKVTGEDILTDLKIDTIDTQLLFSMKSLASNKKEGEILIKGQDIKKLIFNNLSSLWFFFPDNQKSPFEISFNFIKENKQLNILNGNISSDAIEGSFASNQNKNLQNNLQVDLVKLDINKFITNQKKTFVMEEVAYLDLDQKNIDLSFFGNEENSKTDLILKSLFIKDYHLKDVQASLILNNKETQLKNLMFSVTGEDKNIISGYFDYQVDNYKFIGEHVILGNNINKLISALFTKVNFANNYSKPYQVKHSFEINTDYLNIKKFNANSENTNISADLMFYFSEGMDTILNLNINNINFNDFILLDNNKKYRHLLHHMYDNLSSRESSYSLLRSLLWLRNLYYNINYKVVFNDVIYNNHKFDQVDFNGNIKYRELLIEKYRFLSANNNFSGQMEVSLDKNLPFINIDLDAIKIDLDFLNYIDKYRQKTLQWSKNSIKVPNLSDIELGIDIEAQSLKYDKLHLRDARFTINSQDNILFLRNAKGLIDQGQFDIRGKMILDGLPEVNLTYNLTKFQLGNWLDLFFDIKDFNALANWSGSLHSSGNTPHIMIKQLKSKNKFNLANIKINKLAISKINQEIANLSSNPQDSFKIPLSKMIRNGGTVFSFARGDININKGIIVLDNIALNSNDIKANIVGKIDLLNSLMKLNSVFVFTTYYKIKDQIKKTAIKITHQLNKQGNNISGKFNLVQLDSFIKNLKERYLKLYNELIKQKELQKN